MRACVYVFAYVRACVYVRMRVYMGVCVHLYARVYVWVWVYMRTCARACACVVRKPYVFVRVRVHDAYDVGVVYVRACVTYAVIGDIIPRVTQADGAISRMLKSNLHRRSGECRASRPHAPGGCRTRIVCDGLSRKRCRHRPEDVSAQRC